jgi:hypothetical protein
LPGGNVFSIPQEFAVVLGKEDTKALYNNKIGLHHKAVQGVCLKDLIEGDMRHGQHTSLHTWICVMLNG